MIDHNSIIVDVENNQTWLFDKGYTIVYYPGVRVTTPGITNSIPHILVVLEHDKKNNMYRFNNGLYGYKEEIESNSDALADFYDLIIKERKEEEEKKRKEKNNVQPQIAGGKTARRRKKRHGKSRRRM